jgi:MFS family permease
MLIGAGNGVFFTGLTSLLTRLATGPTLDSVFALRYWLINLGNSTGALIGGGIVSVAGERALTPMYLANAATSVVLAVVACALPLERGAAPGVDSAMPERSLAWTPNLISLVAAHTLLVLFGFAAFEAVVPFAFVGTRGTPIALAHLIVAASTLAILGAQIPISRWGRSWPKAQLLQLQALLWALAALLGWSAAGASPAATWLIALAYGALFGVGECLFAAGLQSLVVRSVERDQLGRFNGVLAASYSGSLAIGPALGFGLIGRGSTASFWLAVGGAMLLAFALWSHAARHEARTL